MKNVSHINWKKYAFEFLSIFIAVTAAFALNKWNENRNKHDAENKILSEIYYGLAKDLDDIQLNVMGHKNGIRAVDYFRELLADKPVPMDSLLQYYFNLTRDFVSIQNTSGYETLKSKGLELIRNDSLRTKIISLYEYDFNTLRKLEEEYYELQFQNNYFKEINNSLANNFTFNEDKMITGFDYPLRLEPVEEKAFLMYLWKIRINRNFILQYYSDVGDKITQLREDIKNEIKL